ncbi:MAG: DUF177 domain-containing protein [Tissierellia bacterium]|nr:DUF177 domain-containing protein [Tissierellia bacterium]
MLKDFAQFLESDALSQEFEGQLTLEESPFKVKDLDISGPIDYQMTVYKVEGDLEVDLEVAYALDTNCSRCLSDVHRKIHSDGRVLITQGGEDDPEESLDDVFAFRSDGAFPLEEVVFSQVITSVPQKILCKDDCLGLCPVCGVDLNEDPDHHHEAQGNNPFGILQGYIEKDKEV